MDWDRTDDDWAKPPDERRSYFTMSEENNYTIWNFLKKCHDRGLVYRGYDAMPWCPRCSVGLSQMEMAEGYNLVAHRAVFVRFPLRREGEAPAQPRGSGSAGASPSQPLPESLLVWTTTPWTLSSNVGAAVNPTLTYLKVAHKDQVYYLAKGAFTAKRLEEEFKRKEWVDGVPKLKSLEQLFKEKGGFEIVGEVKGADMLGWTYDGPFDELPAQGQPSGCPGEVADAVRKRQWAPAVSARDAHRVIAWEAVGETEGTGIVHIAPGCGKEDFLLGKEHGLPPVAPLDEYGVFLPEFGDLAGKSAVDHATTDWILDNLQHKGVLFAVEKYPHKYPHCWRCKTELLFRLVDEWFINMSWREEIMRVVEQVTFLPESINGKARELDWLKNMGDWMISKKRFWGLALPIWVDEKTGDFEVIGSRAELKARAVDGWDQFEGKSPHRAWVDLVKIRNPKTGNLMSRIGDVGNPWLDAGIVPYSTMGYNKDRAEWAKWFPADFITECFPGQFRNWFYAILAMSTMMERRPPFKVLLGHGLVRDQWDEDMHKSKGNAIPFDEAAGMKPGQTYTIKHELRPGDATAVEGAISSEVVTDERDGKRVKVVVAVCPPMSADLMRWMYCRHEPAANIDFGPGPAAELRAAFELKLWNVYAFFVNYANADKFDPAAPPVPLAKRPDIDRWILSDLRKLVETARTAFEAYDVRRFCLEAEKFVDDKLSNWYVRRNRRRFWKSEAGEDKVAAYQTLYTVLTTLTRLMAPVMPFLTETMYQNLEPDAQARGPSLARRAQSVHLCDYPKPEEFASDEQLSADMNALLRLVSLGSAARNVAKIKVRQPLAELKVQPASDADRRAVERFADQIIEELNVKKVTLHDPAAGPLLTPDIKANMKTIGPKFGPRLKDVQAAIAAAPAAMLAEKVQAGQPFELLFGNETFTLDPADVVVQMRAPDGWAGVADRGTQVIIDARITDALKREGMARDVVRQVQQARKDANLEMEDRIELYLGTESAALRQAIDAHRDYIGGETLTTKWATTMTGDGWHKADVKIEGQALTIALRKI
jgi:isoleucyl-tRNA synthetase